jgi:hypothetical protein
MSISVLSLEERADKLLSTLVSAIRAVLLVVVRSCECQLSVVVVCRELTHHSWYISWELEQASWKKAQPQPQLHACKIRKMSTSYSRSFLWENEYENLGGEGG